MLSDDTMKEYIEDCDKAKSNIEAPLLGGIVTPLCKSCVNVNMHYGTWDKPECSIYDPIPEKYIYARSWDCPHYKQNPDCPQWMVPKA